MTCQACDSTVRPQQQILLHPSSRQTRPFRLQRPAACVFSSTPPWRLPEEQLLKRQELAAAARRSVLVMAQSMTVTVTGAGGRTGKLIMQKLLAQPDKFTARAVVRDEKGKQKLEGEGVPAGQIFAGDIVEGREALEKSLQGADALLIATSGVPQIKPLSLIGVFWKKLLRQEGARPDFTFKKGQYPEQIDWLGQKAQIDAAKEAGVKKVVLISSMGGTDENNPLNKLGNGDILIWKRKAEEYLIDCSAFKYTIIHPGGLIDEECKADECLVNSKAFTYSIIHAGDIMMSFEGKPVIMHAVKPLAAASPRLCVSASGPQGGKRELVLGVDDELLKRSKRSIPRADVAELAVQGLSLLQAENRSIDAISKDPGDGKPTTDFASLFGELKGDCKYGPGSVKPAASK